MKQILKSNISFWHFSLVVIATVLLCGFLYVFVIPIAYWLAFGEGAEFARIESLPINIFIGNWGALILVLASSTIALIFNALRQNFSHAKSYLLAILVVFVLYLFRLQIENLL
jgi:hypothetical protein